MATTAKKKLPITGLKVDDIPASVLVCGDPARATKTATHLHGAELLNEQREYRVYRGAYDALPVAVCSHGVSAAGAAIAFEELIAAGARRIIRIGTCGGLQRDVQDGDLVIATAAVDATGYGRQVTPFGYPAVADWRLVKDLVEAASTRRFVTGIVLTNDNFYGGVETAETPHYPSMTAANVVAVEMECAALFKVGSLRGVQTAAILAVDGNVMDEGESMDVYHPHRSIVDEAVDAEIDIALRALLAAAANDSEHG